MVVQPDSPSQVAVVSEPLGVAVGVKVGPGAKPASHVPVGFGPAVPLQLIPGGELVIVPGPEVISVVIVLPTVSERSCVTDPFICTPQPFPEASTVQPGPHADS
jgi:hypothetical protein